MRVHLAAKPPRHHRAVVKVASLQKRLNCVALLASKGPGVQLFQPVPALVMIVSVTVQPGQQHAHTGGVDAWGVHQTAQVARGGAVVRIRQVPVIGKHDAIFPAICSRHCMLLFLFGFFVKCAAVR